MLNKVEFNRIQQYKPLSFSGNPLIKESARDEFVHSTYPENISSRRDTLFQRLKNRISPKFVNQKINEMLLENLFSSTKGTYGTGKINTEELKDFIKELSALDYNNIEAKYLYLVQKANKIRRIVPTFIKNILTSENITVETLASLDDLSESTYPSYNIGGRVYHLEMMVYYLNSYKNFDSLPTKSQYDFIEKIRDYFDWEAIDNLSEDDILMQFDLIKDIKKAGSNTAFKDKLTEISKNSPVDFIPVDKNRIKDFMESDDFSFENLKNSLGKINIQKYKSGIPLKYSRADFIADFKRIIQKLNNDEKHQVFKYFKFYIDESDDIIKFPVLNNSSILEYSSKVQNAIISLRKTVEDFTFNNEIRLDKEEKSAQDILNKFIKVFPEFISVIGKIQHRVDSIDFHTLDDLKMCLNNPETSKLSKEDMRILFLATMFHDVAKKQKVLDHGHQKPSAYYAKEIIKKLPLNPKEKERIFNLILNSHWTTDNKSIYDTALNFRFGNDFKLAQILARADGASAGFPFRITEKQLKDIQNCINQINSTGIPLFADNLPADKSKLPISEDGISYIDFTDENADLGKYGYKRGTTVKDLNFLCHNTAGSIQEIADLCDDSKDICLSAEFKNASNKGIVTNYNAKYTNNCHIILHSCNENIGAGGIKVSCTGEKKGYPEFKNYVFGNYFQEPNDEFQKKLFSKRRREFSDYLKEKLNLDDKEYAEFFLKVNQFETKEDIEDISLSSGRILKADEIFKNLVESQELLLKNKTDQFYINEIIMFRPKIEAVVTGKYGFFNTSAEESTVKQIAKKYNIPVILV